MQCQSLKPVLSLCSQNGFVTVDDFITLYTPSYVFYSHGCNKFLHARTLLSFLHSLIPLLFKCSYIFYSYGCNFRARNLFWASVAKLVLWQLMILLPCTLLHTSSIPMGAINFYMQERFLHSLIPILFKCYAAYIFYSHGCNVRAWNLFQCSQTGFVTVDDFIALYTRSYVFYSHGCNKFLHARTFFTLADTVAPIFSVLTEVWPCANRPIVTNN